MRFSFRMHRFSLAANWQHLDPVYVPSRSVLHCGHNRSYSSLSVHLMLATMALGPTRLVKIIQTGPPLGPIWAPNMRFFGFLNFIWWKMTLGGIPMASYIDLAPFPLSFTPNGLISDHFKPILDFWDFLGIIFGHILWQTYGSAVRWHRYESAGRLT